MLVASSAPVIGSRATTRMVSSPAIVPTTYGQGRAVDRAGQVVGRARRGAQHREVAAGVGGHQQVTQQPRQPFGAAGDAAHRAAVLGHDVDADAAVGAAQLDRAEFLEVARQRRLGDVDALVGQHRGQFGLAAHRIRRQDRDDARLPARPGAADFRRPCLRS